MQCPRNRQPFNRSTGDTVTGGKGSTVRRADLARHAAGRVTVRPPSISRHIVPRPASGLSGNRSTVRRVRPRSRRTFDRRQPFDVCAMSRTGNRSPETGRQPPAVASASAGRVAARVRRARVPVPLAVRPVRRSRRNGSTSRGSISRQPCAVPISRHIVPRPVPFPHRIIPRFCPASRDNPARVPLIPHKFAMPPERVRNGKTAGAFAAFCRLLSRFDV